MHPAGGRYEYRQFGARAQPAIPPTPGCEDRAAPDLPGGAAPGPDAQKAGG